MSRPFRNRKRHRQHPYEKTVKSSVVKQGKGYEDTNYHSSSCPSSPKSDHGGDRLQGWEYLLRRKAENINDRILKSKVAESYGGTDEVFSQFVPKQEPDSPTTCGPYMYSSQSWTTHQDASQNYTANEGFWIDRTEERGSQEPEAGQTFFCLTNAHYERHNVKIEPPWSYPEHEGHHFNGSDTGTSRFNEEHFVTNTCEKTKTNQGTHLTVQKLISNIRSAVASNPHFKKNKQDSAFMQMPNVKIEDNVSDASFVMPTFEENNLATQPSEKILNCYSPCNTGCEVMQHATMDSGKQNKINSTAGKTLTHTLQYPADGVEVLYTIDPIEAEAWLKNNIIDCSAQAVGLDIEWKPQFVSKKKGGVENKTAVLQLGVEGSCLVWHLCHMKSTPKLLKSVLRNRKILKVGSGILQDVTKLQRDTGLKCKGMMDTQKMAQSMGIPVSQKLGLKSLANRFLGIDLEKPKFIAMSNWEKYPLTLKQIHYAALDAWIGFKIYQHMRTITGHDQGCVDDEKPVEIVRCHVCGKKVKGQDALATHIQIHSQCKCGQFFVAKISNSHKKKCPAVTTETPCTQTAGDDTVWCEVCDKKVKLGQDALATHMRIHPQCKCGKFFVANISKSHKKKCPGSNTKTLQTQTASDNTVSCQGCGKKCKNEDVLMKHIRERGHVQCPFCNRLLQSQFSTRHIQRCKDIMDKN